jgi:hypothetical protein
MAKKTSAKKVSKAKTDLISQLEASPTEANWKKAVPKLLKEGKYYYVFYPKEVKASMNLTEAYAVIYDKKYKSLYKIPIIKKVGKEIEGATWYLKGLEINRSIIKS